MEIPEFVTQKQKGAKKQLRGSGAMKQKGHTWILSNRTSGGKWRHEIMGESLHIGV
jgi:hypothetical protein